MGCISNLLQRGSGSACGDYTYDKLGEGLEAIAWGESNGHTFTEAVQHETLPIWSVQWHPERMTGPVTNPKECADSLPMFEYFVKQCAK